MMKRFLVFCAALIALHTSAQKGSNPATYAKTITPADLRRHLYIVAGPEMGGRETGMPGEHLAADYIEKEFKRIGLQPGNGESYRYRYNVYQDTLLDATLEVRGKNFTIDRDFNPSQSNPSATLMFSEAVYIGPAVTGDSLTAAKLTGRLVILANNRIPIQTINAQSPGAVLTLFSGYPRTTTANRRAGMTPYAFRATLPTTQYTVSDATIAAIAGKDYETLKGSTAPRTIKSEVLLRTAKESILLPTSNVMGMIRGTDRADEYLFLTAHHDHIGQRGTVINYGADDDGSGTVGIIELAEAFKKAANEGKGPRRTIVFMTVSGEEKGLWGSARYGDNPVYPLEKTTANLNIDMIGRSDTSRRGDTTNYVYVVGDDKISSDLKPISEAMNKKYSKLELDYKFNDPNDRNRIYYRSDHYNFARHGVPIIFYYDGMLGGDYHKPTDTPDKINYNLLARRAQLVFYTAWEMANRDAMLKRDLPLPVLSR